MGVNMGVKVKYKTILFIAGAIVFGVLGKLILGKYNSGFSQYLYFGDANSVIGFGAVVLCALCIYAAYHVNKGS